MTVRLAIRRLLKRPGATLASIVALACGIGAAAATWSLLASLLLQPLPVQSPDRLFAVGTPFSRAGTTTTLSTYIYPTYVALRETGAFEAIAAGGPRQMLVTERGATPQPRTVYFASHDFFPTLGVHLARGHGFTSEDDRRGAAPVAIVSDRYWRTVFDASPGVLGQTLLVNKTRVTIVGVAPRGFRGLNLAEAPDLYLPLHTIGDIADSRAFNFFAEPITPGNVESSPMMWIRVVGRLKAGDTAAAATNRLSMLPAEWRRRGPFVLTDVNTAAIPEAARLGMTQFTRLLSITVGLLLFIGCLTVGMLLLVRTEDRRDEFAVCLALGATRLELARGIAAEGVLLSVAGAALAIPVATALFSLIATFQLPGRIDIELLELSLDWRAWLIAAGSAVAITWIVGICTTAFAFTADTSSALHARAGATARVTRRRTRAALVAAQVAVTLVLVTGAGLFVRCLQVALSLNPGIDTAHIVTGGVSLGTYGYTAQRATTFFDELRRLLSENPAIASVSLRVPEGGMSTSGKITIDDVSRDIPSFVSYEAVDAAYFQTMQLPIVRGRAFGGDDTRGSPPVVIVSESLGRLIAGSDSPIGHRITESSWRPPDPPAVAEVIGVVPDVITDVTDTAPMVKYYATSQRDDASLRTIVVRATDDPEASVREVMTAIRELDPTVTPMPMLTLDEQIGRQMNPQRFGIYVLGALGSIALLLTVLGAFVLAESMASMRRREMSIRAAHGASGWQLATLVLRETATLVGAGLVAGLVLAWMGANTIRALLYRIEPLDPLTLGTVSALILGCALLVSLRPALEAARVDFTRALREE